MLFYLCQLVVVLFVLLDCPPVVEQDTTQCRCSNRFIFKPDLLFSLCLCVFRKSPGEERAVEVIPTPAARPSLRDMHSPQPHAKSTMEEDVKRHCAPDSPPPPRRHKEKVPPLSLF